MLTKYRPEFAQRYKKLTSHYILLVLGMVEFIRMWMAGQLLLPNLLLLAGGMLLVLVDGTVKFLKIKQKKMPMHPYL